MSLTIPEEVTDALKNVRNDSSAENFVVVGYDDSQPRTLALFGTGDNGLEGLKTFVKEDDVGYCLLRVDYTFEKAGNIKSDATRFLFIYYRPESLALKRKMVIGSVEGQVKKAFSPYVRAQEIDSLDSLTDEKVKDIIDSITMSKSNVTDKKATNAVFVGGKVVANRTAESDKKDIMNRPNARGSFAQAKGAEVNFADEEKLKEEIAKVRNDKDSARWCLFSYENKKTIGFEASGDGDVSELLEACPDDKICYGLFRVVESYSKERNEAGQKTAKIDQVRFGFITWVPEEGISPILKAVISTHKGDVVSKFRPFHHQFYIQKRSDLNEQKALDAIASYSGTKSHVTERKQEKKEVKYERKMLGGATTKTQELKYEDKEAIDAAIKDVRSDSSETVWAIAAFTGDKKTIALKFVASGSAIDGALEHLNDETVQYVLIRSQAQVDGYDTTKFTLVKYEGEETNITFRGAAGVYHGAVTDAFGATHVKQSVTSKDDFVSKYTV